MHVKTAWISNPSRSEQSNHDQNITINYLLKLKSQLNTRDMYLIHRSFTTENSHIRTLEQLNTTLKKCISSIIRSFSELGDNLTHYAVKDSQISGRITGVGRDHQSFSFFSPAKEDSLTRRVHRKVSRKALNFSFQRRRLHNLWIAHCSSVPLNRIKFLPHVWNFLCSRLCQLPLDLLLGTTEKSLAPST